MIKKCLGCGLTLQDIDELQAGYTPNIANIYCKRCFRLKNYGEKDLSERVSDTAIIKKINEKEGVVFFLVDYLNINQYTLNIFKKIKLKKVLVISKIDILRKDMKFTKIKKWLALEYKIKEDILFISTNKHYGIKAIINYMAKYKYNNSFIAGITNAGKSTLLNALLKEYQIKKEIVVSNKPNTTLDFIKIKLDNYIIYDTPGFTYPNFNTKIINKEIKPITYNITKPMTINFANNYELSFLVPTSITCYFNNSEDLEKSFTTINGSHLFLKANQDIVIPGLGFINVKQPGEVIINRLDNVEVRNSLSGVSL